jgi:hypothetical protein
MEMMKRKEQFVELSGTGERESSASRLNFYAFRTSHAKYDQVAGLDLNAGH